MAVAAGSLSLLRSAKSGWSILNTAMTAASGRGRCAWWRSSLGLATRSACGATSCSRLIARPLTLAPTRYLSPTRPPPSSGVFSSLGGRCRRIFSTCISSTAAAPTGCCCHMAMASSVRSLIEGCRTSAPTRRARCASSSSVKLNGHVTSKWRSWTTAAPTSTRSTRSCAPSRRASIGRARCSAAVTLPRSPAWSARACRSIGPFWIASSAAGPH